MPNLRLVSDQTSQSLMNEGQLGQPSLVQTLSGLPPPGQGKLQPGLTPYAQEGQVNTIPHNPLAGSLHWLGTGSYLTQWKAGSSGFYRLN